MEKNERTGEISKDKSGWLDIFSSPQYLYLPQLHSPSRIEPMGARREA
jgi:hypothetical protein